MSPRIRCVLLRPRNPENVGAAARALKNFGLADWAIVAPGQLDFADARRVAVQAEDWLENAHRPADLDAAIGDCVWVVGTSSRHLPGKRRLSPREFAKEAVARSAEGPVALVFGNEHHGLDNEELARCHDLSAAPTDPAQPSINLAQAVLLYAYELRLAALEAAVPVEPARPVAASDEELERIQAALRETLRARGVLRGPERHVVRDLFQTLRRSRLSRKEAQLWMAALKGMGRP